MKKIGKARYAGFHQMCITMKLIALLLTVALMEAHGGGIAQNVSLSGQNLSLKKVFAEIKHQTGYAFFYNYALLREAHPVSLHVKEAPLAQVLELCFAGQPLDYSIENKTIVVTRKVLSDGNPPAAVIPADANDPGLPESVVIKGRVTNEKGEPVAGATVKVSGEKIGTATDADGAFSIRVPAHSVLVISSVGYQTREIVADKDATLNIQLKLGDKVIEEVVVTGFGESRAKRSLGYSVTQINGDQIREANAVNPIVALQGMVPGLQVQPGVGGPSATPRFLIRGSASLDPYGNTPLVVVDGVILDDQSVLPNNGSFSGADFGNILKDINPDDIESLSVLKGGAVTALYGSRAANGVILIKTKRGYKSKGIGVSFAHSDYVDHPYKTLQLQNQFGSGIGTSDWDTLSTGELKLDPSTYGISFGPAITGQKYLDPSGQVITNTATNPMLLYRNGLTDNTNVSLNAAGDHSTFRLSYSNLSANGIAPNNELKRNSVQLRVTDNLSDKISVDASASYVQSGAWNPALQGNSSVLYALGYDVARNFNLPYWASHIIDPVNGGYNTNDNSGLVAGLLYPLYENNQFLIENNFRGSVQTIVHILPWMDFQGNVNANIYSRNENSDTRGQNPGFSGASYSTYASLLDQFRYNGSLFFKKNLSKDWLATLQAGGEVFTSENKGNTASTNGTILPDVYRLSNSQKQPYVTELTPNTSQISSLFYQGSFQYKGAYFLNYYGRNDWNSTLVYNDGHGTYSYFYPGVDFAWIFTDAIRNFPPFFNYGKLRFSYDQNGNGTDPYTANTGAFSASSPYVTSNGSSVNAFGYTSTTLPNQHLIPERSSKFEAGLEFKMLHNRLGGDITVYTQNTKDQIIQFSVPVYSGVTSALLNGGVVRNRGVELMLTGSPIKTKTFTWNSQFNYTLNRNKVLSLPLGANYQQLAGGVGIRTIAVAGGDYGLLVGQYAYARYQATDASGKNIASPLNGQHVLTVDASGTFPSYQQAVNYGTTPNTQEPVIGTTLPSFLGSWQNSFTYKQFTLSIFLDSRFGGLEYSNTIEYGTQNGNLKSSLYGRTNALGGTTYTPLPNSASYFGTGTASRNDGILLQGVFQQGTNTMGQDNQMHNVGGMTFANAYKQGLVQPIDAPDYYIQTYGYFQGIREAATFKSDWIVVRDLSLGYDLPATWATKMKMNGLRAIISVRNPFYLYNAARDKINPDNQNDTGSGNAFDAGGIPYIRTYGFAINGNF
jgi:iron complex outermembrane recepter protein